MIRDAASVILLRPAAGGFEVLLMRRHRGASFMAAASVFPGGAVEAGEDLRTAAARELREEASVTLASPDVLVPWAHWITPSIETKRFSAHFFVAELPAGQTARPDHAETVDLVWVTPGAALARSAELRLPPPQVRTCWELSAYSAIADVLAAGPERAAEPHAIMPRLAPGERPCLLLPWDGDYERAGTGDGTPMATRPRWASGPSRFVMTDGEWKHV